MTCRKCIYAFNFIINVLLVSSSHAFLFGQRNINEKKLRQPNLLIIIADQWRGQAIGFMRKEKVKTPVIDSFATKCFVMQQMVGNFPLCSPSRAMLMTGQYPLKNHVYSNVNSASHDDSIALKESAICWSDVLKAHGYFNGYIGKWHLDSPHKPYIPTYNNAGNIAWNEWTPPNCRHGFDYWYAYGTYDKHSLPMYWATNDSRDSFHYVHEWGPIHETDKALAFLKNIHDSIRPSGKPFALMVSFNPPHSEYLEVPAKYTAIYKDLPTDSLTTDPDIPSADSTMGKLYRDNVKYYYAAITGIDEQIGRLLNGLKENHLNDNTIVLIISDHDNCLGKHNEEIKNNFYEESLNILPFILYWKGHIIPRMDNELIGSMPDIYPTILELIGIKNAIPEIVDGKSYASYILKNDTVLAREQFILGGIPSAHVRINAGFRGIRTKKYKLVYQKKAGQILPYFFDLQKIPLS